MKFNFKKSTSTLLVMSLVLINHSSALTLNEYLEQVKSGDNSYKAAESAKKASESLLLSSELLTGVNFFANGALMDDKRPTNNVPAQGDRTEAESLSFGLNQRTSYGVNWSLSQNYQKTTVHNASASFLPVPEYYDVFPKAEVSINLLKNFAGRQVQAETEKLNSQTKAQSVLSDIEFEQKIIQAETAFWNLYYANLLLEIQKDNLNRAEKLLVWTTERKRKNFAEDTDVFQAQAAVAQRKLAVQNSEMNLKEAARQFNKLRGVALDEVNDKLKYTPIELEKLKLTRTTKTRKDIKATILGTEANKYGFEANSESLKPQLDLNLMYLMDGRDIEMSEAQTEALKAEQNQWMVQLNFVMPLDQSTVSKVRDGYKNQALAQESLKQSYQEQIQLAWNKLVDQGQFIKDQIEVLTELEVIQKNKANSEMSKFNNGRSTTFQVLNFEQEYINTREQKISAEFNARQFVSQLKLFE